MSCPQAYVLTVGVDVKSLSLVVHQARDGTDEQANPPIRAAITTSIAWFSDIRRSQPRAVGDAGIRLCFARDWAHEVRNAQRAFPFQVSR